MTEEQKKLLDMLKEIDAICRKNGIVYYLAGGTCIGAIRHRGFIPWDDDMDIYMTRANWEKFMDVARNGGFPKNRRLMCQELEPTYTNMFGRYCDTTTTALHKHNMYPKHPEDDPCGAIVDILVLDPVPTDDPEFMTDYAKKLMLYSELIVDIYRYGWRWFLEPGRYVKKRLACLFAGRRRVRKKIYQELFSYDEEQCNFFAMRWGGVPLLFRKEWFQEPVDMPFEDMTAMMPTMSNAYLTMHYGDNWMYIPAHGEREGHDAVFRMDIRYDDFRREYMPLMPKHRRFTNSINGFLIKVYKMKTALRNNQKKMESLRKYGEHVFQNVCSSPDFSVPDFYTLLESGENAKIRSIIGHYEDAQLSADFIGREDYAHIQRFLTPVLIDVPEDFFEFFVIYCIRTNKIARGLRMMEIKEKGGGNISDKLKQYRSAVLKFREAMDAYDSGENERALRLVEELKPEMGDWDVLLKLNIRLLLYRNVGNINDIEDLLHQAENKYSSDGEFLRYRIEWDRKQGKPFDPLEALETGSRIHETTTNGIIYLAVDDECRDLMETWANRLETAMKNSVNSGNSDEAEKWLRIGSLLYEEERNEEYHYFSFRSAFRTDYDPENYSSNLSRVRTYILRETDFEDAWTSLYHETLLNHGYDEDSAMKMTDLSHMTFEEAKEALDSGLSVSPNPAGEHVMGAYLYKAGRTKDAMCIYQKLSDSADSESEFPFITAEAKYALEPYLRFIGEDDSLAEDEEAENSEESPDDSDVFD